MDEIWLNSHLVLHQPAKFTSRNWTPMMTFVYELWLLCLSHVPIFFSLEIMAELITTEQYLVIDSLEDLAAKADTTVTMVLKHNFFTQLTQDAVNSNDIQNPLYTISRNMEIWDNSIPFYKDETYVSIANGGRALIAEWLYLEVQRIKYRETLNLDNLYVARGRYMPVPYSLVMRKQIRGWMKESWQTM